MNLGPNQAIKTLRDGASWHGGDHRWSLPVANADGTHTAGEWTTRIAPSVCDAGWHLTTEPARWWSHEDNVAAYLAEYDGATSAREGEDKLAVERCRLLRPLTKVELESCGIFTDGEHEVKTGAVYASGNASVTAYDSASVRAYGSASVRAYGSASVRAYGSASVTASGSASVTAYGSASVTAYDSASVTAYDSASVTAYGSASVRAYGSASVRAYGSASVTAYDSASVTAYDSASVTAYGSASVTAYDSASVTAYDSASVTAYDSASVRAYGSASVRAYGSASVTASGSARTHTAGSAVCTAWLGTTLVLTRADNGVIIDRRGDTPKTYCKRAGLDGWRYADGKWERRAAKK